MYKLLIVDDEYYIREGLKCSIDWSFYNIEPPLTAKNAVEALEIIKNQKIDIVLTDIKMKFMDGLELIGKIKENGYGCRFIVMSGYREFEYARCAIEYGVDSYLLKPLNNDELVETVVKITNELEKENLNCLSNILERAEHDIKNRKTGGLEKSGDNLLKIKNIYSNIISAMKDVNFDEEEIFKGDTYKNIFESNGFAPEMIEKAESFYEHCMHLMENREQNFDDDVIYRVKEYIDENYTGEISLAKLEKIFFIDFTYLSKKFKQTFGETYMQYLTSKRIEKAKILLKETNLTVKEISCAVGYNNTKYFSHLFKKYTGGNPTEYRM